MTIALLLAAAVALPHALRLERAAPPIAVLIWTSALSLRALAGALAAVWLVFFFPATDAFAALTRWCLHDVLPGHVNGHDVGHAATLVPALAISGSLAAVLGGTWRLGRRLRRVVAGALGYGPAGSRIIGGRDVLLAAVGMRRPQVLISAGALVALDDAELAAGLAHERGHIVRYHRYVLAYAELCRSLGRLLPGNRRALAELAFHLERDADRWALANGVERRALASALYKATDAQFRGRGLLVALGGHALQERLGELLDDAPAHPTLRSSACRALAVGLAALALVVALALPPVVVAGVDTVTNAPAAHQCEH
jgi:bla regulator protein blaR1